jgi:4'-phosphopantetheinyl transferase
MSACAAADLRIQLTPVRHNSCPTPDLSALRSGQVQVWSMRGEVSQNELATLEQFLSEDECERADRFRFPADRNQFITSRGSLRRFIGSYLGCEPGQVKFQYSEKGKPQLEAGLDLCFNVAHSGELILWAFTYARRIGIDVEKIRPDLDVLEISERFFSLRERTHLSSLPAAQRQEAFFRCWSRKEAYVKATGDGLSLPLADFDVSISTDEPARLVETRPDRSEAERWTMYNLNVAPAYAAAIVVERESLR